MNSVQLIGRLTRDPEVRYSQGSNPLAVARYTLAINRAVKKDGHPHGGGAAVAAGKARHIEADFIDCVAFGKSGEFAEKWLKKGMRIAVEGHIQTGAWTDKDGKKRKSFDIVVDRHHFCESGSSGRTGGEGGSTKAKESTEGFYEIDENIEDADLPF